MPDGHQDSAWHDLLEQDRARLSAARRVPAQLAAIAAQAPGYLITMERHPGRRERFVAKAVSPMVHPHLVMTDDLDELLIELLGPPGSARIISFTEPIAEAGDDEAS
jgi:hypothetical protein